MSAFFLFYIDKGKVLLLFGNILLFSSVQLIDNLLLSTVRYSKINSKLLIMITAFNFINKYVHQIKVVIKGIRLRSLSYIYCNCERWRGKINIIMSDY